jgi:hypothetical protein
MRRIRWREIRRYPRPRLPAKDAALASRPPSRWSRGVSWPGRRCGSDASAGTGEWSTRRNCAGALAGPMIIQPTGSADTCHLIVDRRDQRRRLHLPRPGSRRRRGRRARLPSGRVRHPPHLDHGRHAGVPPARRRQHLAGTPADDLGPGNHRRHQLRGPRRDLLPRPPPRAPPHQREEIIPNGPRRLINPTAISYSVVNPITGISVRRLATPVHCSQTEIRLLLDVQPAKASGSPPMREHQRRP